MYFGPRGRGCPLPFGLPVYSLVSRWVPRATRTVLSSVSHAAVSIPGTSPACSTTDGIGAADSTMVSRGMAAFGFGGGAGVGICGCTRGTGTTGTCCTVLAVADHGIGPTSHDEVPRLA